MTVEERAEKSVRQIASHVFHINKDAVIETSAIIEVIKEALRDQAKEYLKVVDEELAARRKALKEAAHHNRPYDFRGHSDAITAAETIATKIRALADLAKDDGPDDRFDLGGFECNEKQEA